MIPTPQNLSIMFSRSITLLPVVHPGSPASGPFQQNRHPPCIRIAEIGSLDQIGSRATELDREFVKANCTICTISTTIIGPVLYCPQAIAHGQRSRAFPRRSVPRLPKHQAESGRRKILWQRQLKKPHPTRRDRLWFLPLASRLSHWK